MNLLLIESDYFVNENCLLPKSLCVCMIRFIGDGGIVRGSEELQRKDPDVTHMQEGAREEREAGAKARRGDHHVECNQMARPT